jgi:hypothetical protein
MRIGDTTYEETPQMSDVVKNLKAAKVLIDTPEKWGKGSLQPADNCFCAIGAVMDVSMDWVAGANRLSEHLPDGFRRVVEYNDHPDTTHADIMALFDRAIAAAEATESASC